MCSASSKYDSTSPSITPRTASRRDRNAAHVCPPSSTRTRAEEHAALASPPDSAAAAGALGARSSAPCDARRADELARARSTSAWPTSPPTGSSSSLAGSSRAAPSSTIARTALCTELRAAYCRTLRPVPRHGRHPPYRLASDVTTASSRAQGGTESRGARINIRREVRCACHAAAHLSGANAITAPFSVVMSTVCAVRPVRPTSDPRVIVCTTFAPRDTDTTASRLQSRRISAYHS